MQTLPRSRDALVARHRICETSEIDLLIELDDLSDEIRTRQQRVSVVLRLLEDTRRESRLVAAALARMSAPATPRPFRLCSDGEAR
jgi:hypothetical protein